MADDRSFESSVGEWRYGECAYMSGCGWSQRGNDPSTWEHHLSLGAARVRAADAAQKESEGG